MPYSLWFVRLNAAVEYGVAVSLKYFTAKLILAGGEEAYSDFIV
jgi:hypothetical protein